MASSPDNLSHAIVSSEAEELILVDENDREIGYETKGRCHDGDGILHRAFSVFVFNGAGELLLQQRSEQKRLWPLYWSNSCCSHPRRGETMAIAAERRMSEELGLRCDLEFVYKFQYQASFGELGSENELCSVFVGRSDEVPATNRNEIAAVRYVAPEDLDRELAERPDSFTPWFKMEWQIIRSRFT